jgi:23S rRNA (uracil1939-C5)-methyltransferase
MTKVTTRLTIQSLNNSGQGMARHPEDGTPLFFEGLWPGDEIEINLLPASVGVDAQVNIVAKNLNSGVRQDVSCPYHGHQTDSCRGCPWLAIRYSEQLKEKHRKLQFWLKRVGLENEARELAPMIPSEQQTGYRNRAQFKTDGDVVGYVAKGIKQIIPIQQCLALNEKCQSLLREFAGQLPSPHFHPQPGHSWNFFEIDDDMKDISEIQLNKPRPFKQANTQMNRTMRLWLEAGLAKLDRGLPVLELFCGDGNFTQVAAGLGFSSITAVESAPEALARLRERELRGVVPVLSNLYRPEGIYQITDEKNDYPILLANPSYQGLLHRDLYFKKLPALHHFFYIACNPEKMTHDLAALKKKGWKIESIVAVDLFPNTPHFETMAYLKKES